MTNKIMPITIKREITQETELKITGVQLAQMFWDMDEFDQSEFFNELGTKRFLVMQLEQITNCKALDSDGRHALHKFGQYAHKE